MSAEQIAEVIRAHQPTTGMSVASGVTCRCGYWNGNERAGVDRPVGYQGLQWHQAQELSAAGFGLVADAKAEASTSTQWGWRRSSKSEVRVVPSAYSAADVYHKLQDDGRTWRGVKYQIVSREITDWEWRETVAKTEGGKHAG